ncbi:hypothetical protein GCM10010924_44460 [Rhizobium wenxiniae]|nr:hypothetical protein GCM10010924_44460 [Rhizobium wenxiniae]
MADIGKLADDHIAGIGDLVAEFFQRARQIRNAQRAWTHFTAKPGSAVLKRNTDKSAMHESTPFIENDHESVAD